MDEDPTTVPPRDELVPQAPYSDLLLDDLNRLVNLSPPDAEIGITLSARGAIVTGRVVPRDTWLEHMGSHFEDGETNAALAPLWPGFKRATLRTYEGEPVDWFVHLLDAHYLVHGGFLPSKDGMPVRVLISSIDSWSLTSFRPSSRSTQERDADPGGAS